MLDKAIHDLYAEKERLERAIASLEELQGSVIGGQAAKRRGRKSMEASERLKVSDRMKKYWASRRKKQEASQA
ncbi:MAG: hypothetical protein ACLQVN_18465 [Bryobacteraceae bacterium]